MIRHIKVWQIVEQGPDQLRPPHPVLQSRAQAIHGRCDPSGVSRKKSGRGKYGKIRRCCGGWEAQSNEQVGTCSGLSHTDSLLVILLTFRQHGKKTQGSSKFMNAHTTDGAEQVSLLLSLSSPRCLCYPLLFTYINDSLPLLLRPTARLVTTRGRRSKQLRSQTRPLARRKSPGRRRSQLLCLLVKARRGIRRYTCFCTQ